MMNSTALFQHGDESAMMEQLPSVLKEDVYFHQYGHLIEHSLFLQEFENSDVIWIIVRFLKKQQHELGDYVYRQNEISDNLYLIHSGNIRIYTEETQHSLFEYGPGQYFGSNELFTSIYRLGSAFVTQDIQFYRINKFKLDNILLDYKDIKKKLVIKAIKGNRDFL